MSSQSVNQHAKPSVTLSYGPFPSKEVAGTFTQIIAEVANFCGLFVTFCEGP